MHVLWVGQHVQSNKQAQLDMGSIYSLIPNLMPTETGRKLCEGPPQPPHMIPCISSVYKRRSPSAGPSAN